MEEFNTLRPFLPTHLQNRVDTILQEKGLVESPITAPEPMGTTKVIGKTPDGQDVYEDENGKRWLQ